MSDKHARAICVGREDVEPARRPTVLVHAEQCKGCGRCVVSCPNQSLVLTDVLNAQGYRTAAFAGPKCTGCGICFYACPEPGAITVYKKTLKSRSQAPAAADASSADIEGG